MRADKETSTEAFYRKGGYLDRHPTWHAEDSPWKATHLLRMLRENGIRPRTVCEIGCGAGEILRQLHDGLDPSARLVGYDVAPDAVRLCKERQTERLRFELGDVSDVRSQGDTYDLVLVVDVVEHVEDCFGFLRAVRDLGEYKLFHLPLDLSVQSVLRRSRLLRARRTSGHIHYFNEEIALALLEDVGYQVLDYCFTAPSLDLPTLSRLASMAKVPRKLLSSVDPGLAARLFGGMSLLVLAR